MVDLDHIQYAEVVHHEAVPSRYDFSRLGRDLGHDQDWRDVAERDEQENFVEQDEHIARVHWHNARDSIRHYLSALRQLIQWADASKVYDEKTVLMEHKCTKRLTAFLSHKVRQSARTINGGKKVYIHYRTLFNYVTCLCAVFAKNHNWRKDKTNQLKSVLKDHIAGLRKQFGLQTNKRRQITFKAAEVRKLMDEVMYAPKCYDTAIQFCTILCLFLYTGVRPGSIFPTDAYMTFAKLRDIKITRVRDVKAASMIGFKVVLTTRAHKGAQNDTSRESDYTFGTTVADSTLSVDFGLLMVSMLCRRGILSPDKAWNSSSLEVTIPEENLDEPLFLASRPGVGGLSTTHSPLTAAGARIKFRTLALSAGYDGSGYLSLYAIRRGTATTLLETCRMDQVQRLMGHEAGTKTLAMIYDQSVGGLNLVNLYHGDTDREVTEEVITDGPSATFARTRISVKDLIKDDPELLAMALDIYVLEQSARGGSDAWLQRSSFKSRSPGDLMDVLRLCRYTFNIDLQRKASAQVLTTSQVHRINLERLPERMAELVELYKATEEERIAKLDRAWTSSVWRSQTDEDVISIQLTPITAEELEVVEDDHGFDDEDIDTGELVGDDCGVDDEDVDLGKAGEGKRAMECDSDSGSDSESGRAMECDSDSGSDSESGDNSGSRCNIGGAIERALDRDPDSENRDMEGSKTHEDVTSSFAARKKAYLFNLCALQKIKGVLCSQCVADTTVPNSACIRYEGNKLAKHLELEFHRPEQKLWRYLNGIAASSSTPCYIPQGSLESLHHKKGNDVPPASYGCPFPSCGKKNRGRAKLVEHVKLFHQNDIPKDLREGLTYVYRKKLGGGEQEGHYIQSFIQSAHVLPAMAARIARAC